MRCFISAVPAVIAVIASFMSYSGQAHADEFVPDVVCELPDLDLTSFGDDRYRELAYVDHFNRVYLRFIRHVSQECWLYFEDFFMKTPSDLALLELQ